MQNNDVSNCQELYLVSEWVSGKEVDEKVGGGVDDEEDVHHDDAVEEPEGEVVHLLRLASHLSLNIQRLVQARQYPGIDSEEYTCQSERSYLGVWRKKKVSAVVIRTVARLHS